MTRDDAQAFPDPMVLIADRLRDLVYGREMALDPDGLWRNDGTFVIRVAEGLAAPDDPAILRYAGATERAALIAALCDWAQFCPVPAVRAMGRQLASALRRMVDDGTPLEKSLGLSPDQGQTASYGVKLETRNGLLRRLRASIYADLEPRPAARAMRAAWSRYVHDENRKQAPQGEPRATFWRLAEMRKTADRPDGLATTMPGIDRLSQIIAGIE